MQIPKKLFNRQRRIGLTGGIASGKSTITNYIKRNKQIPILDADVLSKELIKPNTEVYKKLLGYFGNQILDEYSLEKVINSKQLKKIIFEEEKHRKWIQQLMHPLIKKKMIDECNQYKDEKIILLVIPLLFEANFTDLCTEIWLVKCPEEIQIKRLIERDKISEQEAQKIINLQFKFDKKSKFSDIILDNSDNLNQWKNKIKKLI